MEQIPRIRVVIVIRYFGLFGRLTKTGSEIVGARFTRRTVTLKVVGVILPTRCHLNGPRKGQRRNMQSSTRDNQEN